MNNWNVKDKMLQYSGFQSLPVNPVNVIRLSQTTEYHSLTDRRPVTTQICRPIRTMTRD